MTAAWVIRAGHLGEREDEALREGFAIAGWAEVGDLSSVATRDELRAILRQTYPDRRSAVIANWTGQLWRLLRRIEVGDLVVVPLKTREGQIAIGQVTGPYRYRADAPEGFRHVLPVTWLRTDVQRADVRPDLLNSMGSLLTVFGLSRHSAVHRIAHLAKHGSDPGRTLDENGGDTFATRDELLDLAAGGALPEPPKLTIRELLDMWGAGRRTDRVVAEIEADLADRGLTTQPPFTEGWIHNRVQIVPVGGEPEPTGMDDTTAGPEDSREPDPEPELPPVSLRIGDLQSAASGVTGVRVGDSLDAAITLMLMNNFSQLVVFDDNDVLVGAVSWESMGKARLASPDLGLAEATDPRARVVRYDEDLLGQIDEIYRNGYVFVRGADHKITGIVTAADLTQQFGSMSRPFALIEEVERRLRRRVDETFPVEVLRAASKKSGISSAADLTLGNYEYVLKDQTDFNRLKWPLDRVLFLSRLSEVRKIRNELMHFSPDPPANTQLDAIEGFLTMLRSVDPRP
ncbi:CBS domain-containing protein [Planosporangium sp. 12N6]|uniref:CBS domain-containing protein n=1 Tax=Planosporangium spinosum TaxID=3402278 RepID=UPI003CEE6A47